MLPQVTFLGRAIAFGKSVNCDKLPKPVRYVVKGGLTAGWTVSHIGELFMRKQIDMPWLEIMVTQRCSLNCKNCANLMNHFEEPVDFPIDTLLDDTKNLLNAVRRIRQLRILGGEPFLYKELGKVIDFAADSPKVKLVDIVTNGTIIPSQNLIQSLQKSKVRVIISPYDVNIAKNSKKVEEFLKSNGITYVKPLSYAWRDYGGFERRNACLEENKRKFAQCSTCVTLINGEVFCCARAGNGTTLGLVPKVEGEYVRVRDCSITDIQAGLCKLSRLKTISTCDYCDYPGPEIPSAIQAPRKRILSNGEIDCTP